MRVFASRNHFHFNESILNFEKTTLVMSRTLPSLVPLATITQYMKYYLILLLMFIGTGCVRSQTYSDSTLMDIQNYLIDFKKAIDSKNVSQIESFIFPTASDRGDIVGLTVKHILKNDRNNNGNFAYSDGAFNLIKDSLYVNFKPVPDNILKMLRNEEDQRSVVDQFKQNDIAIFDFNSAHIFLLLDVEGIKLFFWENMNKLLD